MNADERGPETWMKAMKAMKGRIKRNPEENRAFPS